MKGDVISLNGDAADIIKNKLENTADRVLAWMFLLEAPEEGGETEFLYQSKRIPPEVGNVLMWPAYFTHLHRGNPPIKGHKLYATGWFVSTYNWIEYENNYIGWW